MGCAGSKIRHSSLPRDAEEILNSLDRTILSLIGEQLATENRLNWDKAAETSKALGGQSICADGIRRAVGRVAMKHKQTKNDSSQKATIVTEESEEKRAEGAKQRERRSKNKTKTRVERQVGNPTSKHFISAITRMGNELINKTGL
jgi:hypothetical protein